MRKKIGLICLILGAVLLLAALLLLIYNRSVDAKAGKEAEAMLEDVMEEIALRKQNKVEIPDTVIDGGSDSKNPDDTGDGLPADTSGSDSSKPGEDSTDSDKKPSSNDGNVEAPSYEMPSVSVGNHEFIGYLTIPALGLELPVLSQWDGDYSKLNIAPCRHYGSTVTDDLVIAGHNYTSHFAYLDQLSVGHTILFTDMNGYTITYSIEKFEVVDPKKAEEIKNSGYDLVLYTCTYSGSTRYTVFANRIENN